MIYEKNFKKTKRKIVKATLNLIKEKKFDSITVNDITEKVDINRSTFYRNFVDKYDLINQIENVLIDEIRSMHKNLIKELVDKGELNTVTASENLLITIKNNFYYIQILLGKNSTTSFKNKLIQLISESIDLMLANFKIKKNITETILLKQYLTYSFIGIVTYWIENPDIEAEFLFNFIYNANKNGILSIILENK